ncbi:MAG: DUF1015 domain-containing protein [Treponema sp.]|nr:DUF1015 domain-containing protein [Treponema sp.]
MPEILLPAAGVDLQKWAVVACDQFTQDREYWEKAAGYAGDAPSALKLIFPEAYLADADRPRRIGDIHRTMDAYLREGIFAPPREGCVYVERSTPLHPRRRGLVAALDLERYDWRPGSRPLIRATEGTVSGRLPPRMEIRRGAPLEIPHILILIDDEGDALLPELGRRASRGAPTYRSPLMMGGGDISGWFLDAEEDLAFLAETLEGLARRAAARYGTQDPDPFLYAVGDGNHSLAAAREIWLEYKKTLGGEAADGASHALRWALVEIENLYDPGIQFEPIHRVLFGVDFDDALDILSALPGFSRRIIDRGTDGGELSRLVGEGDAAKTRMGLVAGERRALIETEVPGIVTAGLQPLLDEWLAGAGGRTGDGGPSIDYIHGAEELFRLAAGPGKQAAGILLPPVKKSGLFETVARSGPLPRKSFSMGEAGEKRYYLECRKLFDRAVLERQSHAKKGGRK